MTVADAAHETRLAAISRLLAIGSGPDHGYSPEVVAGQEGGRSLSEVVIPNALCATHLPSLSGPLNTCGRCGRPSGGGHDEVLLDEIRRLAPIAKGDPFAVMDAMDGLPTPADAAPSAEDTAAALEAWSAA